MKVMLWILRIIVVVAACWLASLYVADFWLYTAYAAVVIGGLLLIIAVVCSAWVSVSAWILKIPAVDTTPIEFDDPFEGKVSMRRYSFAGLLLAVDVPTNTALVSRDKRNSDPRTLSGYRLFAERWALVWFPEFLQQVSSLISTRKIDMKDAEIVLQASSSDIRAAMDATMEINDPLRFYARGMQKNATFLLNQLLKSACNAVVVDYQARQLAYARVNPDDSNSTKISFEPIAVRINDRLNDPSNPNSLAYYGVRAAVRINGFTLLSAAENARETAEAVKESEKIAQHLARATTISMKPYLDAGAPPWLAVIGGLLSPASPLAINPTGGISFPWFNRGGKKPNSDESQDEDPDKKKKKK